MNITTQMQQIAAELPEYDRYFTPLHADGFVKLLNKLRLVEFTIIGDNDFPHKGYVLVCTSEI